MYDPSARARLLRQRIIERMTPEELLTYAAGVIENRHYCDTKLTSTHACGAVASMKSNTRRNDT